MTAVGQIGSVRDGDAQGGAGAAGRRRVVPQRRRNTGGAGGMRRAWKWYGERLWPTVVLLGVVAATATLTNSAGRYVGDNRFEQYFNPARRVAKTLSIWDASRGLGRVREDFWPGTTFPLAALRALGTSPILTEHLWHALAITVAGMGMVQVLRIFRPRVGAEHLLAAALMAFGPFSASFLTPFSNLYFQYALAPWFVWVFYRGLHSEHSWRWAAAFALLVLAPGNVDTPGLIYNLMPLVAVVVYVVFVERSVRFRHFMGFVARAGPLALLVNAAVLVKIYQGAATYGQRLNDTESADISFRASSWTESLRGLGNWLSYYRESGQLLKPQGALYFSNWVVIVCTFVPAVMAVGVLWLSRWRPRILFAMMALTSLVVLVGAYPLNEPSPLGSQVYRAFTNVTAFFVFRNTYKAGAGMVMGISALFGVGTVALVRRVWHRGRDRQLALIPALGVVAALFVAAFPFWSNNLYNPTQQSVELPEYWVNALKYLDEQPDASRVLILPATSRSRYRWGWVGDDIFDAFLARPHAVATGVTLSTPLGANLLEAVSNEASNPAYKPGTLAPILRRLGMSRVLLRNDLDWQSLHRPRPADYQGLRDDPDFRRVTAFGSAGENTASAEDRGASADLERKLPPVEVWELKTRVSDVVRVEAPQPSLVVSGDGWAWGPLAEAGVLGSAGPVEYSGSISTDRLRELTEAGSPVAITDTNRRRLRVLLSYEPDYSHTLGADQNLDRPAQTLFSGPGTQSVAWFEGATAIDTSGTPRPVGGSQPWYRSANALDGDPSTVWLMRRNDAGRTVTMTLREPKEVSHAVFTVADVDRNDQGITRARLRFSDGSEEIVNLGLGAINNAMRTRTVPVTLTPRQTSSIELTLLEAEGDSPTVGLADVAFDGIDLTEYVQAPDDVFAAAAADPSLEALIEKSPMSYTFTRSVGDGPITEETAVRRRFRTAGDRSFAVQGKVRITPTSSDAAIDRLAGPTVGAYGSSRADGSPTRWAGAAVDGDVRTAWEPPSRQDESIVMRFPKQKVTNVSLSSLLEPGYDAVKRVLVVVGDKVQTVNLRSQQPCPLAPNKGCRTASVDVEPTETDHVEIRITGFDTESAGKARVDEVVVNGARNALSVGSGQLDSCHDIGLKVTDNKNQAHPVPVKLLGTLDDLLSGRTVKFESCADVRLASGWHLLDSGGGSAVDSVRLIATDGKADVHPVGQRPTVAVDTQTPTRVNVTADSTDGAVVLLEQSFARSWVARVNGEPAVGATPLDTLNGWRIEKAGKLDIELVYGGQFSYNVALFLTALGVVICAALVFYRPPVTRAGTQQSRTEDRWVAPVGPEPGERRVSTKALVGTSIFAAVVAYLLAGFGFAIVLAAIAVAVFVYRVDPGRPAAMGAFVLLMLAAVATVLEVVPGPADPNLNFGVARPITTLLGTMVGALTATAVALFAVTERSTEPAQPWFAFQDRRAFWGRLARSLPPLADRWAPVVLASLVAGALAYMLGPPPLSAVYDVLVRSVRAGTQYSLTGASGEPTAVIPPLAPGLAAFGPLSGPVLRCMLAMGAVLVVARTTYRRLGYRAAVGAAFVAAVLPAVWGVQLAVSVAGLAVLGAAGLAQPPRLTLRRAFGAGLCCGIAGLARPDAALLCVPVLIVWILWSGLDGRSVARAATIAVVAAVAMSPWLTFVRANFQTWLPTDSWASALGDPNAGDRLGGATGLALGVMCLVIVAWLLALRGVSWAGFTRAWLPFLVLPVACVALAAALPAGRDALGWSGLLLAVMAGYGLDPLLRRSGSSGRLGDKPYVRRPRPSGRAGAPARAES